MKKNFYVLTMVLIIMSMLLPSMASSHQWDTNPNGSDIYYDDGNVGIGTSDPAYKLDVKSTNGHAIVGENTNTDNGRYYGGYFTANSVKSRGVGGIATGSQGVGVVGYATATGDVANYGGYFRVYGDNGYGVTGFADATGNGTNYGGYFRADGAKGRGVFGWAKNSGNYYNYGGYFQADGIKGRGVVGIAGGDRGIGVYGEGTEYAGYFKGRLRTGVLEITGGADIAEPFDVIDIKKIKPGMVVAIDSEQPGQLKISDKAYDRTVAGIISGANGIKSGLTMTQKGSIADGTLPVSLTGRVYAWADTSNGPIEPGDILTTSDTAGHAMKVTDYEKARGAVLGKAMTGLKEGKGLVLVLVALQ